ncbi:MAG: homoserine dehydrogenase [Pseudomonadota bacterium]
MGLLGLGTVAQGVLDIIGAQPARLAARAQRPLQVDAVASRRLREEATLHGARFSTDLEALVAEPALDLIVECIGGIEPARSLVAAALTAGKSVVTANKALIAEHGNELEALAAQHDVRLAYEAAVAGGIPVLNALTAGLSANRIDWLAGIINGTSNYILTAMAQGGQSFAEALADAQRLGYAEADPTFDVGGIDAAHKLAILAALAFDTQFAFAQLPVEGIEQVTPEDMDYAQQLGYVIKHVGLARRHEQGLDARVHPALVPKEALLARTDGVTNAVVVGGDAVGITAYVGPGAGRLPTASAVVADLVALARDVLPPRIATESLRPVGIEQARCGYYLHLPCLDEPGVFAKVATVLGAFDISIDSVIQREQAVDRASGSPRVPVVLITHRVAEAALRQAVAELEALPAVVGTVRVIRVEQFDDR